MFARVSTLKGIAGERYDEGVEFYRDKTVPEIEEQPGFTGALLLADRDADVAYAITFWESKDAMLSSADAARKLASGAAGQLDADVSVEMLEVAFSKLPALTT